MKMYTDFLLAFVPQIISELVNLPNKRMTLRTESWLNECLYLKAMAANIQRCSSSRSESHSTAQLTRARRVQI